MAADGSHHPRPLATFDIEAARTEALRKVDAMFSTRYETGFRGFAGVADSVARANAHRLRREE